VTKHVGTIISLTVLFVIFLSLFLFEVQLNKGISKKLVVSDSLNLQINNRLSDYDKKEKRLKNITESITTSYDKISNYEARFYAYIFDDFSTTYHIPWEAYMSLVQIESGFNPSLTSDRGAKGFTQLLDGTFNDMCKQLDIPHKEGDRATWNTTTNMIAGFTYFSIGASDSNKVMTPVCAGTAPDSLIALASCFYLGGPCNKQRTGETREYLNTYRSSIMKEFRRNRAIYRGIVAENSHCVDLE
jgi:hypothetical protein